MKSHQGELAVKILVACDGSQESRNAIKLAKEFPVFDKQVSLISVNKDLISETFTDHTNKEKVLKFDTENKQNCEQVLSEAQRYAASEDQTPRTHLVTGYPTEEICKFADLNEMDIIAMGHRGLNPVKRFFMGSVSDGVLRHSRSPVLLAGSKFENGEQFSFKKPLRILFGYDGSHSAERAFCFLKKFDLSEVSRIDILSVIEIDYYFGMSSHMAERDIYPVRKQALEKQHDRLKLELKSLAKEMQVESHIFMDCQDVVGQFDQFSMEKSTDLIVVGNKGLSPIDRLLLGSVSSRLAHQVKCPLLIVR